MYLTCEGPDFDNTSNKVIEADLAISGVPPYDNTNSLGRGGEGRGGEGRGGEGRGGEGEGRGRKRRGESKRWRGGGEMIREETPVLKKR